MDTQNPVLALEPDNQISKNIKCSSCFNKRTYKETNTSSSYSICVALFVHSEAISKLVDTSLRNIVVSVSTDRQSVNLKGKLNPGANEHYYESSSRISAEL